MAKLHGPLKAQDILVLLRLLLWNSKESWSYAKVAKELGMGASEVHSAIKRAERVDLIDPLTRRPNRASLTEFLVHGLRYAFPAEVLGKGKGMPTAHAVEALKHLLIVEESDNYVWPMRGASVEGVQISPLYPAAPKAAKGSKELYELLALIDAIRVGRVRERELAVKELTKRINSL
jgi:hypothetical protein